MNTEINDALRQPDVRERLALLGFDPHAMSSTDFAAFVKSEVDKWARVIKATGITPN